MQIAFLIFGTLFGFVLSRAGATEYDKIENMFLLQDLHLMGVISVAILTAATGLFLFRRLKVKASDGKPLAIEAKPRNPGNLWGGLLFGAGWAITGTCPGTALSQIGEGKLTALFTITGIVLGTLLYRKIGDKVLARLSGRAKSGSSATARPARAS